MLSQTVYTVKKKKKEEEKEKKKKKTFKREKKQGTCQTIAKSDNVHCKITARGLSGKRLVGPFLRPVNRYGYIRAIHCIKRYLKMKQQGTCRIISKSNSVRS